MRYWLIGGVVSGTLGTIARIWWICNYFFLLIFILPWSSIANCWLCWHRQAVMGWLATMEVWTRPAWSWNPCPRDEKKTCRVLHIIHVYFCIYCTYSRTFPNGILNVRSFVLVSFKLYAINIKALIISPIWASIQSSNLSSIHMLFNFIWVILQVRMATMVWLL